jgi:hypothetical protein
MNHARIMRGREWRIAIRYMYGCYAARVYVYGVRVRVHGTWDWDFGIRISADSYSRDMWYVE